MAFNVGFNHIRRTYHLVAVDVAFCIRAALVMLSRNLTIQLEYIDPLSAGQVVDTDALVSALESGTIGGAALDVTEPEPLPASHPLLAMDNVIVTPHMAFTHSQVRKKP